jgi:DHA2 family methylenomycin A resistance protein-like MFS transporter
MPARPSRIAAWCSRWRSIFFINVPLGAAGSWLTARHAVETAPARDRGMDLLRQLAAVVGLAALASATIEAGSAGFGVQVVIGGYVLAVVAGALVALAERTRTRPCCRRACSGPRRPASRSASGCS